MRMLFIQLVVAVLLTACGADVENDEQAPVVDNKATLHTFYYSWYMNPEVDGRWWHWDHHVLHTNGSADQSKPAFRGGKDIGANFYPTLGAYSSTDTTIMDAHADMIEEAGIDNVVLSWWGESSPDADAVSRFADILSDRGLTFSFHIEPMYSNAAEFSSVVLALHNQYGSHPGLYRVDGKPMLYVYDSYRLPAAEWSTVLKNDGSNSLRNSSIDSHFIGLWVESGDGTKIADSGFDGFYTYFAVDGFVYGSTTANWPELADFARQNSLMFIPCVGPGYRDDRIRPWNGLNTRDRQAGKYFDTMFTAALQQQTRNIAITSFNEWHEGTQIEPATAMQVEEYAYDNYSPLAEDYYIQRTRYWKTRMENRNE